MKIDNGWIRVSVTIGMYISCAMLALSIFYSYIELRSLGYVPLRFFIIVPICLFVLAIVAYLSEKRAWITVVRLSIYVLLLLSMMIGLFGLRVLLNLLLGEPASTSMYRGLLAAGCGCLMFWLLLKLSNTKWLR
jgi:hypothetical protein